MCKIRIVILDKDKNIEKDYIADVGDIDINIIDRPSLCVYSRCNNNGYDSLILKYSNLDEENISENLERENVFAHFGSISGCLYDILFKYGEYNVRDFATLYRNIKQRNSNTRFQNNIKKFINLAKAIIADVNNVSVTN